MTLFPEDVEDILRILDSTEYDELHLETDRFVLALRREATGWVKEETVIADPALVSPSDQQAGPDPGPGSPVVPGEQTPAVVAREAAEESAKQTRHPIVAPLPGVLYRAAKPGAAPYVEAGDPVEADTVVAILETMKLMNPVRAGRSGRIVEICVANNQPAEQGAVLMWLEPDEHP